MVQLLEIWIKTGSLTWKDLSFFLTPWSLQIIEGVYLTIGNPAFLPLLILDWRTFSGRVTTRWWSQWAKNQVSANQNSRNRWCLIARRTICILEPTRVLTSASRVKFWTADWKAVTADLKPFPNMVCCGCWWLGSQCFTNFPYDSPMVPPWFPHVPLWFRSCFSRVLVGSQ